MLNTTKHRCFHEKIKENLKKWRNMLYSCGGRFSILKMSFLPKVIRFMIRFNLIQTKKPVRFFVNIDKMILKFIKNSKRSRIAKTNFKKKNKVGETQ